MIRTETYRDYLIGLKNMVFKILPLYEEKSETLDDYMESLCFEIYGLKHVIKNLPHNEWYVKSLATLEAIRIQQSISFDEAKKVKKEVFKMLSLIDKQIDQLKGE